MFGLRDTAVHFHGAAHEPVWHPGLKTNMARENVAYSVESSERAVAFLMTVLSAFLVPDPRCPAGLAAWAMARSHVLAELEAIGAPLQNRSTPDE